MDDLNLQPEGKAKSCPGCGGFNHAAWWPCRQHGKNPVAIPIDKERCPECIQRHQEDPIRFPSESIGIRPDLEAIACPGCLVSAQRDPSHPIFYVRRDLLPLYLYGVNGHNFEKMVDLVEKYKLPDGFRCPNCQTHLIPVHHGRSIPANVEKSSSLVEEIPPEPLKS